MWCFRLYLLIWNFIICNKALQLVPYDPGCIVWLRPYISTCLNVTSMRLYFLPVISNQFSWDLLQHNALYLTPRLGWLHRRETELLLVELTHLWAAGILRRLYISNQSSLFMTGKCVIAAVVFDNHIMMSWKVSVIMMSHISNCLSQTSQVYSWQVCVS